MQVYDLQISGPTDVERINAQGSYIYYSSGSAGGSTPCVEVRGINTGFQVKLMPGQGMRMPMGKVERDWLIKPDASIAGALIGSLVIGEGEIFDNRITGDVNVIDTSRNVVLSDQAYHTNAYTSGVAGQYAQSIVWNPEGSGVNVSVSMTGVTTFAEGAQFYVRKLMAPISGWTSIVPESKKIGSSAIAKHQIKTFIGALQGVGSNFPGWMTSPGVSSDLPITKYPFVLTPGKGLLCHGDIGAGISVHFLVEEF